MPCKVFFLFSLAVVWWFGWNTVHSIAYPSKEFRCASILPLGTKKMKQYFNMDVMAHRQRSIAFFQTWFANYFHWVTIKCQLVFYILYIFYFLFCFLCSPSMYRLLSISFSFYRSIIFTSVINKCTWTFDCATR